jgi:hypothetical protein
MAKHVKRKRSTASFNTAAGQYETKHMAKVLFTLPEFSELKILHWEFHLDPEKEHQGTGYDMIIGRDLMQALGVIIDYKTLLALIFTILTAPRFIAGYLLGVILNDPRSMIAVRQLYIGCLNVYFTYRLSGAGPRHWFSVDYTQRAIFACLIDRHLLPSWLELY